MQRTKWGRIVAIAACAIFLSTSGYAQAVFGTIFGSVTDNTGAAIPGATITITDTNKGTSVTATSNEAGEFTVGHLIPDIYDVSVTNAGFKTFSAKGLQVYADQSFKVEAKMEVGGETQTVEVSATTVEQLKTDRADVSTTFTTKEVQDLPIGNRNFTNLQLLLPGAQKLGWGHAASENPQGSQQIQVDGQAFGGVAFELDGTDNQDPILGIIVINPNLDSLTETKITTQNFDAEFGKAVSSVVTAQTKSGTNSFHGSAFDYRESNANQARDPYTQNPPAGTNMTHGLVPAGLRNQFGGSIGGPILKDKLFFFGDFQLVRSKVGTTASMTVPSQFLVSTCLGQTATTTGVPGCDFSQYLAALGPTIGTIYRPSDGQAYPGNVIPAAELSQPALNLFALLQPYTPNKSGNFNGLANNFGGSGTGGFNSDQWDERVDFQATQGIHVFERFSRFTDTLTGTTIFGPAGGAGFGIGNYGGTSQGANDSLAAGFDWAVKPTLVTDFRVGYYRYNINTHKYNQGIPFMQNLGINGLNLDAITSGAGAFQLTEVGASGGPSNGQSTGPQYGSGLNVTRCNCPLIEKEDQYQIVNNWTWIKGNHAFKFGADLRYARNLRVPSDSDRTGILSFGTGPTSAPGTFTGGLGFATFVLGDVTGFNRYVSTSTNAKEFQKRTFFYAQDTWRVTPKLTANIGLRYELYFPEVVNGTGNGALMQMNDAARTDGYLRVAGVGGIQTNMNWDHVTNAYNPRVGVAYQINPKTVIRAGYGRSFDLGVFGSIFGHVVTQNLPVLANQSISPTGGQRSYSFCLAEDAGCTQPAGQPAGGGPVLCNTASGCVPVVPSNGHLPAPGYAVSPKARPNSLRLPTLDAWNASVQQSLSPSLSFTIAYVGNKGTHTLSAGDGNNTNPNEAAIFLPAQYSITGQPLHYRPGPSAIDADGGTSNSTFLQRYYGGSTAACQDPNYGYNNGSVTRPAGLPAGSCGWTNGISYYGDDQDSHYNALQLTLTKQFSKGLSFTANYAWQQGIDFNSGFATWNKRAVRGRNNDIRTNSFVAYGLYQLPFGRNQMFYSNASRWVDAIIGGWQLSPVLTWQSGLPFTLNYGECSSFIPGSAPCYPNGKGSTLKTSLGKYDPIAHRRFFYHGTTTPLYNPKTGVYTPFSGFSAGTLDQIGTAGRNNVVGPSFFNTDLSLQKNVPIHESIVGQFRVDAFNVFNHINPGNPGNTSLDSGDSYISSIAGGGNAFAAPRLLQFSLRVQF